MNYQIHYLDAHKHPRAFPTTRQLLKGFCQLLRARGCTSIRPKVDRRYTITREYAGYQSKRWVVRFCGQWIGQKPTKADAEALIAERMALPNPNLMPAYNEHETK